MKSWGASQFGGSHALLVGGLQAAVADVVHHGAREQVGILEHHAQAAPQVRLFDLIDIDAVVADLAVGDVVKAVDQVGDGGLARAGRATKAIFWPGLAYRLMLCSTILSGL